MSVTCACVGANGVASAIFAEDWARYEGLTGYSRLREPYTWPLRPEVVYMPFINRHTSVYAFCDANPRK